MAGGEIIASVVPNHHCRDGTKSWLWEKLMQYIKVQWMHEFHDEPILIYSEIDDVGRESRKVEIYRNGDASFASKTISAGMSMLSVEPLPSPSEIALDPQFKIEGIDEEEFDKIWDMYARKK
jgi:hypothetical protein